MLAPGTVLAGRYRLERKLGAGGIGEVWSAKNMAVGTDVAVKILLATASANAELVMRFRREAFLLARIRNDHVARVLDFATDDACGLVLVMDLVDGEPVSDVVRQRRLSVEEAIDLGVDVLEGMLDLHRAHIVHRDLKPGNVILVQQSSGKRKAVIVDFGLGKLMSAEEHEQSGITRPDMAVGTLEYMAPEQILNSRNVTGAADIYALGAMLYRAVAGVHLFGTLENVQLAQAKLTQLPPALVTGRTDRAARGLEAIVARSIKRRPEERYPRAEDMLAELAQLSSAHPAIEEEPTRQGAVAPPPPVAEPPRRTAAVPLALAAGILMGAALGTGMTLYFLESPVVSATPGRAPPASAEPPGSAEEPAASAQPAASVQTP